MCGRYSFAVEDELIRQRFGVSVRSAIYKARYNCAPTQELAVVTNDDPSSLVLFRWGLIPFWAKDPSVGNKLINAKAETVSDKPSFRNCFRRRRCLVPADGFYEWMKGTPKIPYRIVLNDGSPFAMAGIWDSWNGRAGESIRSFSIITTTANEMMVPIHDRMPVILLPEHERVWLDDNNEKTLQQLLRPFPPERLKAYAVSSLVNSPANDRPEIMDPVAVTGK